MNNIYLVHCWEGTIKDGWYPWIKEKLEQNPNNKVYMENMPNTEAPKINEWINKLNEQVKELNENTYFIGHSIGCQTILRYLESKNVKKIGGIVLVAPWLELLPEALEDEESKQIAEPWLNTTIDFDKVNKMCNNINCIFSDNDYWVSLEQKDVFGKLLNANIVVLHEKGHISEADGVMESDEILEIVNKCIGDIKIDEVKNVNDIVVETYDNVVNEYVSYYRSKDLKGNVQFQKEIDFICDNLNENSNILDVGTAIGDYPKYLTEQVNKGFKVTGIDSSKNMLEYAKTNAPKAEFKLMNMRQLEFKDNSFDAIICFMTLIHVNDEDCISILNNFDKILKDNGILSINVMEYLKGEKDFIEDESLNPKYKTYFNMYSKEFFIDYFEKKNYKILKFFDNQIFNPSLLDGKTVDSNIFTIIVKKK